MKALVCEMCQSNDLIKQDGMYVCQHCGTKYSVEEAKKLMVDGPVDVSGSTVKVSGIADSLNQIKRAYELLSIDDYLSAERIFDDLMVQDAECFLAYLGKACVENIRQTSDKKITFYLEKAMNLSYTATPEEKEYISKILDYVGLNNTNNGGVTILISAISNNRYDVVEFLLKNGADPNQCTLQGRKACPLFFAAYDSINKPGAEKIVRLLLEHGADVNKRTTDGLSIITQNTSDAVISVVKEYHPEFDAKRTKAGCYVATAVYGSYDCPEVWTLRRYRDNTLATTWYGRAFIRIYYATSPTLVKWFGETKGFKKLWKGNLDRIVKNLNENGVEDTPYNDKKW